MSVSTPTRDEALIVSRRLEPPSRAYTLTYFAQGMSDILDKLDPVVRPCR